MQQVLYPAYCKRAGNSPGLECHPIKLKDENMMEYREKISGELSDDAILTQSELYLESLILLGEECAKAGVGFKQLYEIIAIIKKYIIPLAQKNISISPMN